MYLTLGKHTILTYCFNHIKSELTICVGGIHDTIFLNILAIQGYCYFGFEFGLERFAFGS